MVAIWQGGAFCVIVPPCILDAKQLPIYVASDRTLSFPTEEEWKNDRY